ncbi:MAG: GNAT family N-acetyltransferase [Chloroflexi bacterium]|nr:MAG: hypothetical protein CUN54_03680 [Phototrophicales bacterium]RMF80371.1 MAG: GNAT family N-acetyltransferase [Chloroflexota bacterium]
MSSSRNFVIRDGLERDIADCLALDHTYTTNYVWQMNLQQESTQLEVRFKTERLPHPLEVEYHVDENRLRASLPQQECFLVAENRESLGLLGYLTMRIDTTYHIAFLQDVVVNLPARRRGIGRRLVKIARQWAIEHNCQRITAEVQTKNYPGIVFCRKVGFTFSGFNDSYFLNQDIALFFSQTLPSNHRLSS